MPIRDLDPMEVAVCWSRGVYPSLQIYLSDDFKNIAYQVRIYHQKTGEYLGRALIPKEEVCFKSSSEIFDLLHEKINQIENKYLNSKEETSMKEINNGVIDNVWVYTLSKGLTKDGNNDQVLSVNVHKGNINRFTNTFTNTEGRKFSVAATPGEVKGGKIVWYNEPNRKEAILAFAEGKIDRLDKLITDEENLKKDIRTLFEFADFVERRCEHD